MRFNVEIDGQLYGVLKRKYKTVGGFYQIGYKLCKNLVKDKEIKEICKWKDDSFEQNMKDYPEDKKRFLSGEIILY